MVAILDVDDIEWLRSGRKEKPSGGVLGVFVEDVEGYVRFEWICERIVNRLFYSLFPLLLINLYVSFQFLLVSFFFGGII